MGAKKKSISLPADMLKEALERQKEFGYTTFSDYVQAVLHKDIQERPNHQRTVADSGGYMLNERPSFTTGSRAKTRGIPRKKEN